MKSHGNRLKSKSVQNGAMSPFEEKDSNGSEGGIEIGMEMERRPFSVI